MIVRTEIVAPHWLIVAAIPDRVADDAAAITLTLDLAIQNVAQATGGPFGALVCEDRSGRIVSVGVNQVEASGNPSLHAEVMALALAGCAGVDFAAATLFSSCEPCIMCLGAAHWSGVRRIVFSALMEDARSIGFDEGVGQRELQADMVRRGIAFEGGMLREQGMDVLRTYAAAGGKIYGPARRDA